MTFFDSIRAGFRHYADFSGCATRAEYWWWILFCLLLTVAAALIDPVASLFVALSTVVPSTAAATRRLHDTDRSGWLQLISFIPLIGGILLLVWCCQGSKRPTRFLIAPVAPGQV